MDYRKKRISQEFMVWALTAPVALAACEKETDAVTPSIKCETVTNSGSGSDNCTLATTEIQEPFPTKSLTSFVGGDITDGRTGYKLIAKLTIGNTSNNCAALAGM